MTESKKTKILFGVFCFLIMVSVVATFYRYVILKDFDIFIDEEAFSEALLDY